jgi:glyoxylase-like metal-dependent hydrolase (beta-lactamase superfamily II)
MHQMIRSALVLLAGVVVALLVVMLMDAVVGRVYPLPAGTDVNNPESFRQAIAALPVAAFALLVVGWALAAGAGAYVAARLATQARAIHGLIVALFVLVATVANLGRIPHPTWMWPAAIILLPVAGWAATRLIGRSAAVLAAFVLLLVSPKADAQQSARPLMEEVAQAMGGRDRILAVRTLVLEGTGENYSLGQNPAPEAPLPVFAVTELRRSIDFGNKRWRHEQSREPRFLTANTAAQRARLGYDGVAYDILADGTTRRAAARADAERANELLHHPIGFLQVAFAPGTELTEEGSRGQLRQVRMNAGGNKFAIFIDRQTKLPVRIEKIEYNSVLGDVVLESHLSDWRAVDGLMLPMRSVWRMDGRWPLSDTRFTRSSVNADVGDLSAPAAVRTAQPLAPPAINVTSEEIAPGVWNLAGQSHHSVAIEMRDHLLLVEAPQSDARTLAVIEKARTLRPGKPIRAVINTHHHFDHSGGVRAAVAEGLQVITHERNKPFFEELAGRRHFIVADALSKSRRPARIQGVGARTVLSDGARNVEIHHIRGNRHAETLLMVYLPAEKLLIEADVYSPPAPNATTVPPAPFAANLVENIDRLGLAVDRIVPIHGPVVPISALRAAANPTVGPTPVTQQQPSVTLPPELARVLRDYEREWQARNAAGLAGLFTEDGMTLSSGRPLRRGRAAIREGYANSGGPLALRAVAYATDDTVGYIIGGYSGQPGQPDDGKFVLALRRSPGGPWQIAADIDNSNRPPQARPPGN